MAWIELHQAVWTHRKTFDLAARLGMQETHAAAHVIRLWTWALDNAPSGDLSSLPTHVVARGADWQGDADAFVTALMDAGWLDQERSIHDWHEYAGRLLDRRRQDAERKRMSRVCPPDVRPPSGGGHTPVRRNSTGPDRTGPIPDRIDTTPVTFTSEIDRPETIFPWDLPPESVQPSTANDAKPSPARRKPSTAIVVPESLTAFHAAMSELPGYAPTQRFFETVDRLYSRLDLLAEVAKIEGWLASHPGKRRNVCTFALNWLEKTSERASARRGASASGQTARAPHPAELTSASRNYPAARQRARELWGAQWDAEDEAAAEAAARQRAPETKGAAS